MNKDQAKKKVLVIIKISIAILLLGYLFKSGRLTKENLNGLFVVKNAPFIILSGILLFGSQILSATRLLLLLKSIYFPLRFSKSIYLTLVGMFFNNVIPGAIGGDVVKGYCLIKSEEGNKGRSSGIIVMDRVIGLMALTLIAVISTFYLSKKYNIALNNYQEELNIAFVVIGIFIIMFLAFLVFGRKKDVRNKLRKIFSATFRKTIFYYMAEGWGSIVEKRRYLFYAFLISILIQLMSLSGLVILGNIGSERLPDTTDLIAISSIVLLSGIIPITPGNIGWTELIAALGWSAVGSNAGAVIFFYWRIVTVFCSLPVGLVYIFVGYERK